MAEFWWTIPLLLAILAFDMNSFLRGAGKETIGAVLGVVIVVCIVLAWVVSGWKIGLASIVGTFLLGWVFAPIALSIARRLVRFPDLGCQDYSKRQFERLVKETQSGNFFHAAEAAQKEKEEHRQITISMAMHAPNVRKVLAELGADARDLEALYNRIEICSLPPHLREQALCNAQLIKFFIENSKPETSKGQYSRNVSSEIHLMLQMWSQSNPGGGAPH